MQKNRVYPKMFCQGKYATNIDIMKKNLLIMLLSLALVSCSDTHIDEELQNPNKNDSSIEDVIDDEDEEGESIVHPYRKPYQPIYLNEIESTINKHQSDFSLNLFKAARNERADENFVISPYSVSTALSMLANGADGNTLIELQNVLSGEGLTLCDLNEYNKRIASEIDTIDNFTQLEIANGLFPDKNVALSGQFIDNNKSFYYASVIPVNFSNLAECNPILNKWVDDATHGLIKNMSVSAYTPILIANTIYFKSSWERYFDKDYTYDAPFYNYDNTMSTVKMMRGGNIDYTIDGDFAIIGIPFGNRAFSMYVAYNYVDKNYSLNGIEKILTKDNIKKYISKRQGHGSIRIPRFEVGISGIKINNLLSMIGLKDLFSEKTDLSNLFTDKENRSFKPAIFHECVLRVEESGTEGAAKTQMVLIGATPNKPELKSFMIDHPFVFWIAEQSTGTMLFMGQINKLESVNE
ncbi:MAG: serpin family protein [Muribaculaceae bacterium]|nr:serpin family protein [Muribaculaceae bacterium]